MDHSANSILIYKSSFRFREPTHEFVHLRLRICERRCRVDYEVSTTTLLLIWNLLFQNCVQLFRRHVRTREHALALHLRVGGTHNDNGVAVLLTARLVQKWNVNDDERRRSLVVVDKFLASVGDERVYNVL